MSDFIPFFQNHWQLFALLFALIVVFIINEYLTKIKQAYTLSPAELVTKMNDDAAVLIDIRTQDLYKKGHIINAINILPSEFSKKNINKYKLQEVVIVCTRGIESGKIASDLKKQGFSNVASLKSGMTSWISENLPIIKK
jgi:rhodanese-related sulfurtransferase